MPGGLQGARDFQRSGSVGDSQLASRTAEGFGLATVYPNGAWVYREDWQGATALSRWKQTPNGGAIALDTTNTHRGLQSVKLTTAATITTPASITKSIAFPQMPQFTKFGVDCMIYPVGTANMTILLDLQVFWGNQHNNHWGLSVSPSAGTFTIDTGGYTPTNYTNAGTDYLHDDWHNLKYVVDDTVLAQNLCTYQSVAIDGTGFLAGGGPLGGKYGPSGSSPLYPGAPQYPGRLLIVTLKLTNNTAAAMACNFGDLVITAGEQ